MHPASAEDEGTASQSAIQLREKGFVACAHAVDDVATFLFHSDFSYLNQWNQSNTGKHSVLVTGAKRFADGTAILTITATETQAGTCDATFTLAMPFPEECSRIRQTAFKEWPFFSDKLAGLSVFEDPNLSSVSLVLEPTQGGCLAVKTGVFFLSRKQ
jgi:hypothetical protein